MSDDLIARAEHIAADTWGCRDGDGMDRGCYNAGLLRDLAAALRKAEAERDEAQARLARAEEDAARYQWLKDNARRIDFAGLCVSDMGQLDARIDAFLREREGAGRHIFEQPCVKRRFCQMDSQQPQDLLNSEERDAARYRWLRGDAPDHSERWPRWNLQRWDGRCWHSLERGALDAAIDAAMQAEAARSGEPSHE